MEKRIYSSFSLYNCLSVCVCDLCRACSIYPKITLLVEAVRDAVSTSDEDSSTDDELQLSKYLNHLDEQFALCKQRLEQRSLNRQLHHNTSNDHSNNSSNRVSGEQEQKSNQQDCHPVTAPTTATTNDAGGIEARVEEEMGVAAPGRHSPTAPAGTDGEYTTTAAIVDPLCSH